MGGKGGENIAIAAVRQESDSGSVSEGEPPYVERHRFCAFHIAAKAGPIWAS